jgi:uncharacterized membrane protein
MRKKTYHALVAVVVAVLVFAVGFAIPTGNPLVPAVLILAGIGIVYVGKQRVTDVMRDDLSDTIYGKAALDALLVTVILTAIVFAGITAVYSGSYASGFAAGMAFTVVLLGGLFAVAAFWYTRKYHSEDQ